jgi:catechol 2,3-dioxygenase-like lactoylglutathione lyase family enzyme
MTDEAAPIAIGHIGIATRDLDRAVRFYTDIVGLRLTERFEYPEEAVGHGSSVTAGAFVRCDSAHHCISIFALRAELAPPEGEGTSAFGLHHVAFEMATPEDLLAKLRAVRARGVPVVQSRRGGPGNQPRFYIHDPDGNLVEFFWGIDQIGPQGRPRAFRPIEEIDLERFDFEAYARERDAATPADG